MKVYWKNARGELTVDPSELTLEDLVKDFLGYLNKTEISDNDKEFRPNYISSVRVIDGDVMGKLLKEMEKRV